MNNVKICPQADHSYRKLRVRYPAMNENDRIKMLYGFEAYNESLVGELQQLVRVRK